MSEAAQAVIVLTQIRGTQDVSYILVKGQIIRRLKMYNNDIRTYRRRGSDLERTKSAAAG